MSTITASAAGTAHYCAKGANNTYNNPEKCLEVQDNATLLCLFGGILNLVMGLLHLGFVIDFISYPVLTGFTTSAALTIAWGQVHSLLGLSSKIIRSPFAHSVHDVFEHIGMSK
jgi:MFS superfamily sulfate permease-like transporter